VRQSRERERIKKRIQWTVPTGASVHGRDAEARGDPTETASQERDVPVLAVTGDVAVGIFNILLTFVL
jgi:hypothetical protein